MWMTATPYYVLSQGVLAQRMPLFAGGHAIDGAVLDASFPMLNTRVLASVAFGETRDTRQFEMAPAVRLPMSRVRGRMTATVVTLAVFLGFFCRMPRLPQDSTCDERLGIILTSADVARYADGRCMEVHRHPCHLDRDTRLALFERRPGHLRMLYVADFVKNIRLTRANAAQYFEAHRIPAADLEVLFLRSEQQGTTLYGWKLKCVTPSAPSSPGDERQVLGAVHRW